MHLGALIRDTQSEPVSRSLSILFIQVLTNYRLVVVVQDHLALPNLTVGIYPSLYLPTTVSLFSSGTSQPATRPSIGAAVRYTFRSSFPSVLV